MSGGKLGREEGSSARVGGSSRQLWLCGAHSDIRISRKVSEMRKGRPNRLQYGNKSGAHGNTAQPWAVSLQPHDSCRFLWIHLLPNHSRPPLCQFLGQNFAWQITMSIPLFSLGNIFKRRPAVATSAHFSNGVDLEWTSIPNPQQALLQEIEKLYWNGVRRELVEIILTLKTWQHDDFAKVALRDETDREIYGFDTFLDQVNESSRDFAVRYCTHHIFAPQ